MIVFRCFVFRCLQDKCCGMLLLTQQIICIDENCSQHQKLWCVQYVLPLTQISPLVAGAQHHHHRWANEVVGACGSCHTIFKFRCQSWFCSWLKKMIACQCIVHALHSYCLHYLCNCWREAWCVTVYCFINVHLKLTAIWMELFVLVESYWLEPTDHWTNETATRPDWASCLSLSMNHTFSIQYPCLPGGMDFCRLGSREEER